MATVTGLVRMPPPRRHHQIAVSDTRIGTRYQGINTFLRKTFFSIATFFVHQEHRWGHYRERYGVTIFAVVTNFDLTVLEVPKLQKSSAAEAMFGVFFGGV